MSDANGITLRKSKNRRSDRPPTSGIEVLASWYHWKSVCVSVLIGAVVGPFVTFLLNGGFDDPSGVLHSWRPHLWELVWILPAVGMVWAGVFSFTIILLRYVLVPVESLLPSVARRLVFLSCAGFACGFCAMWVIAVVCQVLIGVRVAPPGHLISEAIFVGVFGIIFAHMFSAFYRNEQEIRAAEDRQKELEKTRLEGELMNMNMRIRPHFFFNALNTLASLMDRDREKAQIFLADLADLFRKSFTHGQKGHLCPFEDELSLLERYLRLEKNRFGERLTWQFDVRAPKASPMPAFFLQPLMENAVHHGIARQKEPGYIALRGHFADERWELELENSCVGKPDARFVEGHALLILRQRARLLDGDLEVFPGDGSFTVRTTFSVAD